MASNGIAGEVLVSDNGGTDGSVEIAIAAGAGASRARLAVMERRFTGVFSMRRADYVLMGDAISPMIFRCFRASLRMPEPERSSSLGRGSEGKSPKARCRRCTAI